MQRYFNLKESHNEQKEKESHGLTGRSRKAKAVVIKKRYNLAATSGRQTVKRSGPMSVFLGMLAVLLISAALTAALVFAIYRRQQKIIKLLTREEETTNDENFK